MKSTLWVVCHLGLLLFMVGMSEAQVCSSLGKRMIVLQTVIRAQSVCGMGRSGRTIVKRLGTVIRNGINESVRMQPT